MKGEEYKPPLPEWDQYGCRVMVMEQEFAIGDTELKETRSSIIHLLQQICSGIVEIIHFFTARPSTNPVLSPQGNPQPALAGVPLSPAFPSTVSTTRLTVSNNHTVSHGPIVLPEPFVILLQRYIVGICDCKDIFQIDGSRTKQQVWSMMVNDNHHYFIYIIDSLINEFVILQK